MASIASLLARHPSWAGLSEQGARALANSTEQQKFSPGQVIVIEGQPARHVYYLVDGVVRVFFPRRKGRAALTLALRGAPGMFGDIAVLNATAYTSSVDALTPSVVLAVEHAAWRATLTAEPRVAMLHYQSLGERFLGATQNQRGAIDPRPVERVAALLLSYAQHTGVPLPEGGVLIDAVVAQEDIAEQTASTRRTVVRALGALFDSGTLRRHGRKLVVTDIDALARTALAR